MRAPQAPPSERRAGPPTSPTASRALEALAGASRPLGTAEVAERAGIHLNSARVHLARLREADLVESASEHRGVRGRPRTLWNLTPRAIEVGEPADAYRELAGWLSRSVAGPRDAREEGRRIGAEIGRGKGEPTPTADAFGAALTSMGFQPRRSDRGPLSAFTLCNCPYRDVARDNPGVVCALHRGVAEGLAGAIDPGARVSRFLVGDPDEAGCLIEIETHRGPGDRRPGDPKPEGPRHELGPKHGGAT